MKNSKRKHNNTFNKIKKFFFCSMVFYLFSITIVQGYNIVLQSNEQELAAKLTKKQEELDQLQNEVNNLKQKENVVVKLDNEVSDNSGNVYVVGEE